MRKRIFPPLPKILLCADPHWGPALLGRHQKCKWQQPNSRTACLITVATQPGMLTRMGGAHALEAVGAIQDGGEPSRLGTLPRDFDNRTVIMRARINSRPRSCMPPHRKCTSYHAPRHTFSAFWLRSSVVSVLISLISDISSTAG